MRTEKARVNRILVGVSAVLMVATACSPQAPEAPAPAQTQVFPDETTENYTMGFSGELPLESSDATAIASDASGKGPFVANVGCDGGGTLAVRVHGSPPRDIPCDGTTVRITDIQKVARTGGVKFFLSSDQREGHWKIQLIGSRR